MPQVLQPPVTTAWLARDLAGLGVRPGELLLVHSSLRALAGPQSMVVGGPVAVVDALTQALGEAGTLVMPAFSSYMSEPSLWTSPPAPEAWWQAIRQHMPAWRPDAIPTRGVGLVPETFRKMNGVLRSNHPQASFIARGPAAETVLRPHPLDDALGEGSPLGRMAAMEARVLMLGCPWRRCTAFHLGELRRRPPPRLRRQGAPMLRQGRRAWVEWTEPAVSTEGFEELGAAFEPTGLVTLGTVARAPARLFPLAAAAEWASKPKP